MSEDGLGGERLRCRPPEDLRATESRVSVEAVYGSCKWKSVP